MTQRGLFVRCGIGFLALATATGVTIASPALASPSQLGAQVHRSPSPGWAAASEVPGTAALNVGGHGDAAFNSLSCPSAGYCSGGGSFEAPHGLIEAFVVDEAHGTWGSALEVPGTATLNVGGTAEVNSVSCAAPGDCAAGGSYQGPTGQQAFVANEVSGTWQTAIEVPGTASLNALGDAEVYSVSCSSAGNCSAGGGYEDAFDKTQAFVITETGGVWGTAVEVPGLGALNLGGFAEINSMACASAGNCSAGGFYDSDLAQHSQAFLVNEVSGVWGSATEAPGIGTLNTSGIAQLESVSCGSAGNCSAGGYYTNHSFQEAFVINEVGGTWRTGAPVPGFTALNKGNYGAISSVSCPAAGDCSAVGFYKDHLGTQGNRQAFAVDEVNGAWTSPIELPGSAALTKGGYGQVNAVSCSSPGDCAAGGLYFRTPTSLTQPFVAVESHGVWTNAIAIPGSVALNRGGTSGVSAISCSPEGTCSAGGSYLNASSGSEVFVTSTPVPVVTSVTPGSGLPIPLAGTMATLRGTLLTGATSVDFGTRPALFTVVNANEIQATVPRGTGTVDVRVTTPDGTSPMIAGDRYTYEEAPTISSLSPPRGSSSGGNLVVVHGTNLVGVTRVLFGGIRGAHVTVVNADAVKVTAPVGTGVVNVRVTTPSGTSSITSKDRYQYG
jgi:IPT/TIG domain-containing protein